MVTVSIEDWKELLEEARRLPEEIIVGDSVQGLRDARQDVTGLTNIVAQRIESVRNLTQQIAENWGGNPEFVPPGVDQLLDSIGAPIADQADLPAARELRRLNSMLAAKLQVLGQLSAGMDGAADSAAAKIRDLSNKVNSEELDPEKISKLSKSIEKTVKDARRHFESLIEEPTEDVIERITDLRETYIEEPFGEIVEFFENTEGLLDDLESSGVTQITEISEIVEQVLITVEFVKSIPDP